MRDWQQSLTEQVKNSLKETFSELSNTLKEARRHSKRRRSSSSEGSSSLKSEKKSKSLKKTASILAPFPAAPKEQLPDKESNVSTAN